MILVVIVMVIIVMIFVVVIMVVILARSKVVNIVVLFCDVDTVIRVDLLTVIPPVNKVCLFLLAYL